VSPTPRPRTANHRGLRLHPSSRLIYRPRLLRILTADPPQTPDSNAPPGRTCTRDQPRQAAPWSKLHSGISRRPQAASRAWPNRRSSWPRRRISWPPSFVIPLASQTPGDPPAKPASFPIFLRGEARSQRAPKLPSIKPGRHPGARKRTSVTQNVPGELRNTSCLMTALGRFSSNFGGERILAGESPYPRTSSRPRERELDW